MSGSRTSGYIPPLERTFAQETGVGPAGAVLRLRAPKWGVLRSITVVLTTAVPVATKFDIEVFESSVLTTLANRIFFWEDWLVADGEFGVVREIPYSNVEDENYLYVRITPDAGSEDFDVVLKAVNDGR